MPIELTFSTLLACIRTRKINIFGSELNKVTDFVAKFKKYLAEENIKVIEFDMNEVNDDIDIYIDYLDGLAACNDEALINSKTFKLFEQSKLVNFSGRECFKWIPPGWWPAETTLIFFKNFRNELSYYRLVKRLMWMTDESLKSKTDIFNPYSGIFVIPTEPKHFIVDFTKKYDSLMNNIRIINVESEIFI